MQRVSTALLALAAACGMNTTPTLVLREISRDKTVPSSFRAPARSAYFNAPEITRNRGTAKHRAYKRARRNNIRTA